MFGFVLENFQINLVRLFLGSQCNLNQKKNYLLVIFRLGKLTISLFTKDQLLDEINFKLNKCCWLLYQIC